MIDDIYNKDVLRLAANIGATDRLNSPEITVELASPLCGSHITVDVTTKDGAITGYGQEIKACALGQAAAAVVASAIAGTTLDELRQVRQTMSNMLTAGGPAPAGKWSDLSALAPAKDATSRHGAILLPFDAVINGLEKIADSTQIPAGA